jgi:peptidyl-dipeptidase Dcp
MRAGLTLTLCLIAQGCARSTSDQASAGAAAVAPGEFSSANPFAQPSSLPYQAPAFDRIRNGDYQPAIEEGMRRQRAELDSIARQPASPTFENTIVALERTGELLTRVLKVFASVVQANTNDTLQRVQTEEAPRLAAHSDALYLDSRLFQRVHSVYQRRASLKLSTEQNTLVERYHRNFVRAGAQLQNPPKTACASSTRRRLGSPPIFRPSCWPPPRRGPWCWTTGHN